MLREFQVSLTVDTVSGQATGYILSMDDDGPWNWIADQEFGPFDTSLDISRWITKVLVQHKAAHLR